MPLGLRGVILVGAAGAVAFGLALWYAYERGYEAAESKYKIQIAEQQATAARTELQLTKDFIRFSETKDAEVIKITERLNTAVSRLRQRPARLPEAARANCSGASGAELSGPDGTFLAGESARADRIRASLNECVAKYTEVKEVIDRIRSQQGATP